MSKFLSLIIGLLIGGLLGGLLTFYFFVGAPSAASVPGDPVKPPDPKGPPPGTATVVLNQQFFNTVLQTIFQEMNAPSFPLNISSRGTENPDFRSIPAAYFQNQNPSSSCDGRITLLPEGSGVKTAVRLERGKISAPLAFRGSAKVFGNCVQFSGWASAGFSLYYEAEQQNVYGRINVQTVNLDGVTPLAGGLVAQFVQNALNQRVNPITILQGEQIALQLPIDAADGTLRARIEDVRAEIGEDALKLYITYDFKGEKAAAPANP